MISQVLTDSGGWMVLLYYNSRRNSGAISIELCIHFLKDLAQILNRLEEECKRSWNFQKSLAKIEDNSNIDPQKNKIQEWI